MRTWSTGARILVWCMAALVVVTLVVIAYFVGRAAGRQQFYDECWNQTVVSLSVCPELTR